MNWKFLLEHLLAYAVPVSAMLPDKKANEIIQRAATIPADERRKMCAHLSEPNKKRAEKAFAQIADGMADLAIVLANVGKKPDDETA